MLREIGIKVAVFRLTAVYEVPMCQRRDGEGRLWSQGRSR